MTKVSRWALEEKREKELLNQFWTAITLLKDKKEVIDFLKALLMSAESIMLAKRIDLVKLLGKGVEINKIRRLLHVTKVTAYKWKDRYGLYQKEFDAVIDRLNRLEKERLEKDRRRREAAGLPKLRHEARVGKDIQSLIRAGRGSFKRLKKRRSVRVKD